MPPAIATLPVCSRSMRNVVPARLRRMVRVLMDNSSGYVFSSNGSRNGRFDHVPRSLWMLSSSSVAARATSWAAVSPVGHVEVSALGAEFVPGRSWVCSQVSHGY